VQLVNSETGVIQPIAKIATLAKSKGAAVHCDAVQAAGRITMDFKSLNVDYLTLSAHKFGGPQGVGALIFREGLQMPKFMRGGGQEKRQRAGTENVAGIAGFGLAAKIAQDNISSYQTHCEALRRKLESGLRSIANDIVIIGETAPRVANTVNVLIPGITAETQLMAMDLEGVSVSSGSACSSGTFKPSHVLAAMGYSEDDAKSALRFSIGWATTEPDIDGALAAYEKMVARIRK
jgi:cysteine desulfurase